MLAVLSAVLPIVWKVAPLLISIFVRNKQERDRALAQFEEFRSKHENDGLLSANLREHAADQSADLKAQAQSRDEAEKIATQAAIAQVVTPPGAPASPS